MPRLIWEEIMKITEFDSFNKENIVFREAREAPFRLYGFDHPEKNGYVRINREDALKVSPEIADAARNPTGGRLRFRTDSGIIVLNAAMEFYGCPPNATWLLNAGFDVYVKYGTTYRFNNIFQPTRTDYGMKAMAVLPAGMKDIIINFPIGSSVEELYVGLEDWAKLEAGSEYTHASPVLYYGSSITHGYSASRPGMTYEALISQRLDCDFINLGFSGRAHGEPEMADICASFEDLSAFVFDYDHNSPSVAALEATHEPFFLRFRQSHPTTPVIFLSRPNFDMILQPGNPPIEYINRREVIYRTYKNAIERGDLNVYFIDGESLFCGALRDQCTMDGAHPNDLGFSRMADRIGEYISRILTL